MLWSEDGTLGSIPVQLDRNLYTEVNKALAAMGGHWNRSAGAHVFTADPRPLVDGLLDTGSLVVERDGFYETPKVVVEKMLSELPFPRTDACILEPSAGKGAILGVLLSHLSIHPELKPYSYKFTAIEKNASRRQYIAENFKQVSVLEVVDFLEYNLVIYPPFDRIYMNPPFEEGQDIDHVRHAYDLLKPYTGKLAAVMSEGVFFRSDKKSASFREWLAEHDGYSVFLPGNSFKESGTGVNTRLVFVNRSNVV
jgi:hypothetical protein